MGSCCKAASSFCCKVSRVIHFVPWKYETQQQLNGCCGGGSQIDMTSCVCLLYTCSVTVQASASDDLMMSFGG